MINSHGELQPNTELAERFEEHLFQAPDTVDPQGVHHIFADGGHGQKVDFDAIPYESSLFDEWVDVCAETVDRAYPKSKVGSIVLLSVAGGTNRVVEPVAEKLGKRVKWALTRKKEGSTKEVELDEEARRLIIMDKPELVLELEDAGTTGSTSATGALSAYAVGARWVEVMNTLQRREQLEKLIAINVFYNSIIYRTLPTYRPEECEEGGFCADGWKLIPRGE